MDASSSTDTETTTTPSSVTLYTFNKYFAELVLTLKKSNPIVKAALAHYKVMDNLSSLRDHLLHFSHDFVNASPKAVEMLLDVDSTPLDKLAEAPELLETTPVRGINMMAVKTTALSSSASGEDLFWSTLGRVLALYVLLLTFNQGGEEQKQNDHGQEEKHVQAILQMLSQVRQLAASGEEGENRQEQVVQLAQQQLPVSDTERKGQAVNAVVRLFQCESRVVATAKGRGGPSEKSSNNGGLKDMLEGSKIGQLVTEMLEEFDPAELNLGLEQGGGGLFDSQNPLDAFANIQNLMRPDSGIGGTVAKLGHKLQQKIGSGDIRVDELLGEAMGLIGNNDALRNNPLVSQLLASLTQQQQHRQPGPGGPDLGGLAQLFSGLSGGTENEGPAGRSSEKNLEKLFADLETAAARGRGSTNSRHHQHQSVSTKDRLRKKYEAKQQHNTQQPPRQ